MIYEILARSIMWFLGILAVIAIVDALRRIAKALEVLAGIPTERGE
jgi:hypothetical protein